MIIVGVIASAQLSAEEAVPENAVTNNDEIVTHNDEVVIHTP